MACTSSAMNPKMKPLSFSAGSRGRGGSRSCSFGQMRLPMRLPPKTHLAKNAIVATIAATEESRRSTSSSLPHFWKQIHGSNNWEYLVEPLHPLLRQEVVRYGEFVIACYKAFDLDSNSKRYLNCKYGKKSLFKEVGMENAGYQVTKYIYATPEVNIPIQNEASCGRWIGYVAVSSDETVEKIGRRDIVVSFRGTVTNPEWIANFMSSLTPARLDPNNPRSNVKVESGFLSLYTSDESCIKFGLESCREQLLSEISRLLQIYEGEEISITLAGHSMGSALALLLAYDVSELGLNRKSSGQKIPVTVFSFAGPRVGNSGFKQRCDELGVKVLRIVNVNDPITKLPGVFFNENFKVLAGKYEFPWSCSCYSHVGIELALDFFNMQNPSCVHDLESYLSLLRRPKSVETRRSDGADLLTRAVEFFSNSQTSNPFTRGEFVSEKLTAIENLPVTSEHAEKNNDFPVERN